MGQFIHSLLTSILQKIIKHI